MHNVAFLLLLEYNDPSRGSGDEEQPEITPCNAMGE